MQGIANLATLDANKKRIYEAAALPMLVRCLNERQHQWDKAVFWSAGALWNLAFDDDIKKAIPERAGRARRAGGGGAGSGRRTPR